VRIGGRRARPIRRVVPAGLVAAVVMGGTVLGLSGPATAAAPPPSAPLATGLADGSTFWAVVPMGRLGDPLNTFWEAFAAGPSGPWQLVTPKAVASNGGLVLAPGAGALTVGFQPSQNLVLSPLAVSADAGAHWSPGLLPLRLGLVPDALAERPSGGLLALTRAGVLVVSAGSVPPWRAATSAAALAATGAGRTCRSGGLSAVAADPAGQAVLGTSCASARVGVFVGSASSWRLAGPTLGGGVRSTRVLRLVADGPTLSVLVGTASSRGAGLVDLESGDGGATWSVSASLPVPSGTTLVSTSPTASGFAVQLSGPPGSLWTLAYAAEGGRGTWDRQPAPPSGTQAVVPGPGGLDALAVSNSRLTVWSLAAGTTSWARTQSLEVPVPYGSSS